MLKHTIIFVAIAGLVLALAFSGVADAAITGTVNQPGDWTSSGVQTVNGVNTIDGGSHWTHNTDLFKIGNYTTGSLTVSGGGWLEITAASVGDTYAFQVGNQAGGIAHALVTGTGSKVTTLTAIAVARNESGCTLTIEDGGLVMAELVLLGRNGGEGYLRMGYGGMLAIEGTDLSLSAMFTVSGTGELQYNPSGDGVTWVNMTGAAIEDTDYTLTSYNTSTIISGVDVNGYTVLEIIPEPATMALLGLGGLGLLLRRRRRA